MGAGKSKELETLETLVDLQRDQNKALDRWDAVQSFNQRQQSAVSNQNSQSHDKAISQNSNGFSLVSVNSAQLATGIGIGSLLLFATFGAALYCWCRHRSNKKRKRRHDQLLQICSHRADGGHGSSNAQDAAPVMGGPPPPVPGAYWTRTPMGWASLPLPASNPFVPQFPGMQPAQGTLYSASYSAPNAPSAPPRIEWSPRITAIEEELTRLQRQARAPPARSGPGASGPSATPRRTGVTLGSGDEY
jgi:hypothetical protein